MITMKGKMDQHREAEVEELKAELEKVLRNFQTERSTWDSVLSDKDAELRRILAKAEDDSNRYK